MAPATATVGGILREWRQRRRMSQLDLALEANISARHLSFVETGRAQPSRDMVLHLAERLDVPLRERNVLLTAAGYAPIFPERRYEDPGLASARRAIDLLLKGHEPFPALAVDRHWTLLAANGAVAPLLEGADVRLLAPPVNVLRLSLHPEGLGPRIANYGEWRAHVLTRLRQQTDLTADPELIALMNEIAAYPAPSARRRPAAAADYGGVAVPFQLATERGVLSFFSTTTIFGTPVDVTLSEIALETFFPADEATADALRQSRRG
jgi:transcriptional regulator with XRE-family HTH domain